jgi:hypothetical protein
MSRVDIHVGSEQISGGIQYESVVSDARDKDELGYSLVSLGRPKEQEWDRKIVSHRENMQRATQ